MNRYILLISVILLTGVRTHAQRNNILKLDVHSPIMRTAIVSYERIINADASWGISLLYTDKSEGITNADYLSRLVVTPEFRYYLSKDAAPAGFYLSGNFRLQRLIAESFEYTGIEPFASEVLIRSISTVGAGLNLGFQEVFKDRIALEVFMGPCWNSGDKRSGLSRSGNERPNDIFMPYVGYFLRSGVNVGFLF